MSEALEVIKQKVFQVPDEELHQLWELFKARRGMVDRHKMVQIREGDTAIYTGEGSTRFGLTKDCEVKVLKVNRTTITVQSPVNEWVRVRVHASAIKPKA